MKLGTLTPSSTPRLTNEAILGTIETLEIGGGIFASKGKNNTLYFPLINTDSLEIVRNKPEMIFLVERHGLTFPLDQLVTVADLWQGIPNKSNGPFN